MGRLDYQPLIAKMSPHSSPGEGIKDRTRDIEPSQWTSSNKNLTTALFCHVPESMILSSNSGQYITHFIRFSLDGMDKFIFAQVTTQILLLEIKYNRLFCPYTFSAFFNHLSKMNLGHVTMLSQLSHCRRLSEAVENFYFFKYS